VLPGCFPAVTFPRYREKCIQTASGLSEWEQAMNEQQNTQTVQEMFAAFSRGDVPAILNMVTEDVHWCLCAAGDVPYYGRWRGRDGVGQFFAAFGGSVDVEEFEPQKFVAQGDAVVVLGRERIRVKATGRAVEQEWAIAFALRDGKIADLRVYEDSGAVAKAFSTA
jgi:uncharacterized protein